jgi:hypothetical protein
MGSPFGECIVHAGDDFRDCGIGVVGLRDEHALQEVLGIIAVVEFEDESEGLKFDGCLCLGYRRRLLVRVAPDLSRLVVQGWLLRRNLASRFVSPQTLHFRTLSFRSLKVKCPSLRIFLIV